MEGTSYDRQYDLPSPSTFDVHHFCRLPTAPVHANVCAFPGEVEAKARAEFGRADHRPSEPHAGRHDHR